MDLREMMDMYYEDGLSRELAAARVCQDIVLKAIAVGPLSRNVTINGGVVMRSLTNNNRRATRDIDLDFIHYSIEDEAIRVFVQKMNCIAGIRIEIIGDIEELKHQDYHGKSIKVQIIDKNGTAVDDIVKRIENSFKDNSFLKRISTSRQRWIDEDIKIIAEGIIGFYKGL